MSAAAALSRSFGGLSGQRQGIVSILSNNSADLAKSSPPPPPLSLRRTLSADMSSNTWQLARTTDFSSPMKKIASTNELRLLPDEESRQDQIQQEQRLCDTWSAIMSAQKTKEEDKDLSPPYIHPLVRQSKSCCLSEKSLEICTESLGSETGSEGFSSNPSSVAGDNEDEGEEQSQTKEEETVVSDPPTMQKFDMEDLRIAKLNSNNFVSSGSCASKKSVLPRSFPPPIPSLARGAATETLHMRPHRDNGRLVLEAVSCASRNNFRAQREHGRLVLTFVPNESTEPTEKTADSATAEDQFEVEFENSNPAAKKLEEEMEMEEEEEEEGFETEEENKFEKEEAPKITNGLMSYHRLAVIMNKPISKNQTCWPKKSTLEEEEEPTMKSIAPLTQSLPPRPPKSSAVVKAVVGAARKEAAAANVAAASSFNAYECCWKSKPMPAKSVLGPTVTQNININHNDNYNDFATGQRHNDLVTKRGDYFVPLVKGCKEPRRSILFWEPYCIAT
ncbi:Protein FAF-like, chloroplastic [Linum grandiflorum]